MKSVAFAGICVILQVISLSSGQAGPAENLRNEYENCVYGAVGKTWERFPNIDPSLAVEGAFQACQTEEQAIRALLLTINVPYPQAETTVATLKIRLKRKIREIMADPAGYKRRPGG